MLVVQICEMYGWDYEQYMKQPIWFLELIHKKMEIDGKKAQQQNTHAKLTKK